MNIMYYYFSADDTFVISNNITELNAISGYDLEFTFDTDLDSDATLTFQWQKDGYALSDRRKYKGRDTEILTILDVEDGDEGNYSLIVDVTRSFNISISVGKINLIIKFTSLLFCKIFYCYSDDIY